MTQDEELSPPAPTADSQPSGPQTPAATAAPVPPPEPQNIFPANEENIARAAELLRAGEVVAFPTETVYGLGADASNAEAVAKIFILKGRPTTHPLIVHLADASQLGEWAIDVPESATKLARAFWPGPLTLVLKRSSRVPEAVTGGQDTVALRVPSHPVALALLKAFGGAIAAPSANKFGRVSPTSAEHVRADLGAAVPMILDGGASQVGIESTIVDLTGETPRLLRPGGTPLAAIEEDLGVTLAAAGAEAPRAPGSHAAHYAPRATVKFAKRREIIDTLVSHKGRRVAVLAIEVTVPRLAPALQRVVPAVASKYAHDLYANLRALDAAGADVILVETPPQTPGWLAVNDRLQRAAQGGGVTDAT